MFKRRKIVWYYLLKLSSFWTWGDERKIGGKVLFSQGGFVVLCSKNTFFFNFPNPTPIFWDSDKCTVAERLWYFYSTVVCRSSKYTSWIYKWSSKYTSWIYKLSLKCSFDSLTWVTNWIRLLSATVDCCTPIPVKQNKKTKVIKLLIIIQKFWTADHQSQIMNKNKSGFGQWRFKNKLNTLLWHTPFLHYSIKQLFQNTPTISAIFP